MKSSMQCLVFLCAILFGGTTKAYAQSAEYADEYKAVEAFQRALKSNDRKKVAALIAYPIQRTAPLPVISSPKEFVKHWDEFFDEEVVQHLTQQQPEERGWRGVFLGDGCVRFFEGKVFSLHCEPIGHKEALKAAKKRESSKLYKSAQDYDSIEFKCRTSSLHIRIQQHGDDLRYFAWKKGDSLASKPQLELHNGISKPDGSGGNFEVSFVNLPYTYTIQATRLCGEDCNSYIVVSKGNEEISRRVCKE